MKRDILITTRKAAEYSEAVVVDAEAAFRANGVQSGRPTGAGAYWDLIGRIMPRLDRRQLKVDLTRPMAFVVLMGLAERQLHPRPRGHTVVPLIFDCWPSRLADWAEFFHRQNFPLAFFTCEAAAIYWRDRFSNMKCVWMPEAINVEEYPLGPPLSERPVVLREIGRPHLEARRIAERAFQNQPHLHLHPGKPRSEIPKRSDLVSTLHRSRALMCYPGSVSDPAGRTGSWETMTHRYLEAVATGTVIVGKVPEEMTALFGFKPGIDATPDELPRVLSELTTDPESFQPMADAARAKLVENSTWLVRTKQILEQANTL